MLTPIKIKDKYNTNLAQSPAHNIALDEIIYQLWRKIYYQDLNLLKEELNANSSYNKRQSSWNGY